MRYKLLEILWKSRKGYVPAGRLYSTFRSNLSKNFNFGVLHPCRSTDGGEIWHGGGDLAKFHPHQCNVSPLRGVKPQNRPLSKLNTGWFALRAMLPVNIHRSNCWYNCCLLAAASASWPFKSRLHVTTSGWTTGCFVYTNIQPVVKRLYNRVDNRLYRENGVSVWEHD